MTLTEDRLDDGGTSERIFFKEGSPTQQAEVLLVLLEDSIIRRFKPKIDGVLSAGAFGVKIDEVRSKVEALKSSSQDANFLWICEKIKLLINLCVFFEGAVALIGVETLIGAGIEACNDTDYSLDCLQVHLRQREEEMPALKPIIKRLAKCKAHYVTKFTEEWSQQIRWQTIDHPRTNRLTISLKANNTFEQLTEMGFCKHLRTGLRTDTLRSFIKNIVCPVVENKCVINVTEKSAAIQLEATFVERTEESKVDPIHNLQTVYSFITGTLFPVLKLDEHSRQSGAVLNLLSQRAREESCEAINQLVTSLPEDFSHTRHLLTYYATEAEASKAALQVISEMEEMVLTALEPTEKVEIANLPKSLMRAYVVSSWMPSLAESVLRLQEESILLPVFCWLLRHFTALEREALCSSFKAAVFLNNCFFLANRCSLHCPVPTNSIIMLKQKGTSVFLRFINEHKMSEVSMSLPVSSALRLFSAYITSLHEMEVSWKRALPFEIYSKATGLLFNSLSSGLETYIFQQKFLTDNEVVHLKSLLLRAVSLAEAWQCASSEKLHVSSAKASQLLRLMQMTPDDILVNWKSSVSPLSSVYTADQVTSLAKARFTLEEFEKLHSTIF